MKKILIRGKIRRIRRQRFNNAVKELCNVKVKNFTLRKNFRKGARGYTFSS